MPGNKPRYNSTGPSNGRHHALAFTPREPNAESEKLLKGLETMPSAQLQLATFEASLASRVATERKSDASSASGRVVGVPGKIVFLVMDPNFVCGDFDVAFNGQLEAHLFTRQGDQSVVADARKPWLRIVEAPENTTPEDAMLAYSRKLGNMYWSGADLRIYIAQQKGLSATQEAVSILQRGFPGKVVEIDTRTYSIVDVFPGFSCPVCRFVFPSSEQREAHQGLGGTCTTCGLTQACASVAHAHASAGAMLCSGCKEGFACMGLLSQHLADQRCPCGARFHCAKQADEHRRAKCEGCATAFKCAKALDDHKKQGAEKCGSCGEQPACAGAAKQHAAASKPCAVCGDKVCESQQLKHKSLHADKEWPALPTAAPAKAAAPAKHRRRSRGAGCRAGGAGCSCAGEGGGGGEGGGSGGDAGGPGAQRKGGAAVARQGPCARAGQGARARSRKARRPAAAKPAAPAAPAARAAAAAAKPAAAAAAAPAPAKPAAPALASREMPPAAAARSAPVTHSAPAPAPVVSRSVPKAVEVEEKKEEGGPNLLVLLGIGAAAVLGLVSLLARSHQGNRR
eukprot:tig00001371_g8429.t1